MFDIFLSHSQYKNTKVVRKGNTFYQNFVEEGEKNSTIKQKKPPQSLAPGMVNCMRKLPAMETANPSAIGKRRVDKNCRKDAPTVLQQRYEKVTKKLILLCSELDEESKYLPIHISCRT